MATGRLASTDITSAATDILLYSCPSNKVSSFSICMANRTSNTVQVRIALTNAGTVTADSYIAYDVNIYPNEVYERSGLVLGTGQYVFVRSTATSVNAVMYGYEE